MTKICIEWPENAETEHYVDGRRVSKEEFWDGLGQCFSEGEK
jgi:hypothetical protein